MVADSALPLANGTNGSGVMRFPSTQPLRKPLKYSGSLDHFDSFEVTTIIGREYPSVQLSQLLNDDLRDVLLKDLAVIISRRGVVFFRNQDLTIEQQKKLTQTLALLSGKPESSSLHVHPLFNGPETRPMNESGERDPEVYVIENKSEWMRERNILERVRDAPAAAVWHTDTTFENIPSDYACLKMVIPAKSGGDTLWASGYELYDRLSPSLAAYLTTLSTTSTNAYFKQCAEQEGFALMNPRGSPQNVLDDSNQKEDFTVTHPVIRTNPVTGWRGLYVAGMYFGKINELSGEESKVIRGYLENLLVHNHDLQVRRRWGKNDIAIWDNRSVFHCATHDEVGERLGYRVISIGEKPYFDPSSKSRREALADEH